MWPLPQLKNEQIHLVIYADRAVCVRFVHDGSCLRLQDYRAYCITPGDAQSLCNIAELHDCITDFVTTFNVRAAYLSIVLTADFLQERLVHHVKSDALFEELLGKPEMHTAYQLQYVGPYEDGFLFYICGVSQALRLQLQLLFHRLPLHMHRVISSFHAQTEVYKHTMKSTFSQARLVQELHVERVHIPAVFSPEVVCKSIKIEPGISFVQEDIVYAWGSFLGAE